MSRYQLLSSQDPYEHRALQQDTGKEVTVLRLEAEEFFERDLIPLPHLSHPALRRVLDVESAERCFLVALEDVVGCRPMPFLFEFLRSGTLEDQRERIAASLTAELCALLTYLYREDPARCALRLFWLSTKALLLTPRGVVLFDYLLRFERRRDDRSDPVLTLQDFSYLSPEEVVGRPVTEVSDVFTVGTILYELLSGRRPFEGDSTFEMLLQLRDVNYPPLVEVAPNTSFALQQIVQRAVQRNPSERYQSAAEMEKELRAFLEERPCPDVGHLVKLSLAYHSQESQDEPKPDEDEDTGELEEEVVKGPFLGVIEQITPMRWLLPDAETDSLSASALSWLEERFDEHLAALASFSQGLPLPPSRVILERSVVDAFRQLELARDFTATPLSQSWSRSILRAIAQLERLCGASELVLSEQRKVCRAALRAGLRALVQSPESPQKELLTAWWESSEPLSPAKTLEGFLSHRVALLEGPSPWAPIFEIWKRGAWPITVLEEGLLLYLPVRQGESISFDPGHTRQLPNLKEWRGREFSFS